MSDFWPFFSFWVLPPALGAIIGYLTNDIAIRMLFRPLREKRIFGIRVPFTPGIIPKQRYQLAESIGRMVSEQLLTEDAVRTQLETPGVRDALRQNIAGITDSLLSLKLSALQDSKLPFFETTVPQLLKDLLTGLLKSATLAEAAQRLIDSFLGMLGEKKVKEVVKETGLAGFLRDKIGGLVREDSLRDRLADALKDWLRNERKKKAKLEVVVSDNVLEALVTLFRSVLPYLHETLLQWLADKDVRANLAVQGKKLLNDILSKLNIFQRFFLSVGQYDRTLSQAMPEIIEDFISRVSAALKTDEDREAIVASFGKAVKGWRKKNFSELFPDEAEENPDEKIERFVTNVFDFLRRENLSEKIADAISEYIKSREEESLAGFVDSLLGLKKEKVTEFVLGYLQKNDFVDNAASRISEFVIDFLKSRGDISLGEALGVDREKKLIFENKALDGLSRVLGERIPEALQSLDIRSLVVNKINSLEMKAVEGLLTMVIAKQLKWINLFGAVLGALIGVVQIVIRLL